MVKKNSLLITMLYLIAYNPVLGEVHPGSAVPISPFSFPSAPAMPHPANPVTPQPVQPAPAQQQAIIHPAPVQPVSKPAAVAQPNQSPAVVTPVQTPAPAVAAPVSVEPAVQPVAQPVVPVVAQPVVQPVTTPVAQTAPLVQQPQRSGFGAPVAPSFTPVQQTTGQPLTTGGTTAPTSTYKESPEDELVLGELDTEHKFSSGNWLKKREIWEKIEEVYDEIKQVLSKIMNVRTNFVSQRNKLDRELDIFFAQMGFEAGPFQEIIDRSLALLKKEEQERGMLNKVKLAFKEKIDGKERDLEQIKMNIKSLQELDAKIDEALDTLFEQIDVANRYEQKAWQIFKDVARELDDKVALVGYYQTEGLLKDITNVHGYLTGQFAQYFNQAIQSAQQHSQTITSEIQALKDLGIDFKKFSEELEKEHDVVAAEKRADAEKMAAAEKAKKEKEAAEAEAKKHNVVVRSYHSVKGIALAVVDSLLGFFSSIVGTVQSWFSKGGPVVLSKERELGLSLEHAEQRAAGAVQKEVDDMEAWIQQTQAAVQHEEEELSEHEKVMQALAQSGAEDHGMDHHQGEELSQRPVSIMPDNEK